MDVKPISPRKATPHPVIMSPAIKEGSVAQRIAQLQANLSPVKSHHSASSITGKSTTVKALSRYSMSNISVSPRNIPLPETPAYQVRTIREVGRLMPFQQADAVLESDTQDGSLQHDQADKHAYSDAIQTEKNPQNNNLRLQLSTPIRDSIRERNLSPRPLSTAGIYDSFITDRDLEKSGSSSCPPRYTRYSQILNGSVNEAEHTPDSSKRNPNTSPGSAYSKILPFMLSPSITSFVPRRQSQSLEADQGSPIRLRNTDSIETVKQDATSGSGLSPSPRYRDQRSLRRRTFNTKSEDVLHRESQKIATTDQEAASELSEPALEDVFVKSPPEFKVYHPEPTLLAKNVTDVTSEGSHDIHNTNYIPSVMPRRMYSRQMMRTRHQRSSSGLMAKNQLPRIVATHQTNQTEHAYANGWNSLSRQVQDLDMDNPSVTSGPKSRTTSIQQYPGPPCNSAASPSTDAGSVFLTDESYEARPDSRAGISGLSTGDGVYSDHGSVHNATSSHQIIDIAIQGASQSVTMRTSPKTSTLDLAAGPNTCTSIESSGTFGSSCLPDDSNGALRVIVTLNQHIQNVVKIEIYPPCTAHSPYAAQEKENRIG